MAAWQEVRVFISSTFRDMHAERDWLVKRVFPRLRAQLEPYRIRLVDIDLRWGITEDEQKNDRVLDLCLAQIDDCRPFFVGILGERYGWVPASFDEESVSKYGWIQNLTGKSVTELEILYGVLRNPEMHTHSFFFFRDPAFVDAVPEAKRGDLDAEDNASATKLRELKDAICDAGLPTPPFVGYPCSYAGLRVNWRLASMLLDDSDREALHGIASDGLIDPEEYATLDEGLKPFVHEYGSVDLAGLETFGDRVFENLWEGIKAEHELPDTPPAESLRDTDPLAEEEELHRQFMESRTQIYIGRQDIQKRLHEVADRDDPMGCVVTGPAGSGKSAVLAKFAQDYAARHPDQLVIAHFVGASSASTSLRQMLRRFCLILAKEFEYTDTSRRNGQKSEEVAVEIPFDADELVTTIQDYIERIPEDQRVVFVIDALNQLDETDRAHDLNWLPREWPDNVNCFVSCITHEREGENPAEPNQILDSLKGRRNHELSVDVLTDDEREAIITEVPSVSAKRLSTEQVGALMENPATQNPLFLLVALEELRGFGSFELLARRIADLPNEGDATTAIFTQVIERLEEDFDRDTVRLVLSWLACARSGLSEQELLELLEGIGTTASTGDLFVVLRQLRRYLQPRGEFLDFYHRSLYKSAREKYFDSYVGDESSANEADDAAISIAEGKAHGQLADYFYTKTNPVGAAPFSGDHAHAISELVYHQLGAGRRDQAEKALMTYAFLQAKVDNDGPRLLIEDCDLLSPDRNSAVGLIQGVVRLSSNALAADPAQLASQFYGRMLGIRDGDIVNVLEDAAALTDAPWLRPIKPCATPPGGTAVQSLSMDLLVAVVANGTRAVFHCTSPTRNCALEVWDLTTCELLRVLESPFRGGESAVVTPDGVRAVMAVSTDFPDEVTNLISWDVGSGTPSCSLEVTKIETKTLAVTPDGKHAVFFTEDGVLMVWNLINGENVLMLDYELLYRDSLAITPDGTRMVYPTDNDTLKIWDLATGSELVQMEGHREGVESVQITPDGSRAISMGSDKIAKVWSLSSGELISTIHMDASVILWIDDTRALTCQEDHSLNVWFLDTGEVQHSLRGQAASIGEWTVSPNGALAVSSEFQGSTLNIWDLTTGSKLLECVGHAHNISCVAFTPDGSRVVTGSEDSSLKVWDVATGRELITLTGHSQAVETIEFMPDGYHVVSTSEDETLRIWYLTEQYDRVETIAHRSHVNFVAMTPDGRFAVSGCEDHSVKVWEVETGNERRTSRNETADGTFPPFGLRTATAGRDYQRQLSEDLKSGNLQEFIKEDLRLMRSKMNLIAVCATKSGALAVYESKDNALRVWDIATEDGVRDLEGDDKSIAYVAIAGDGSKILSTSHGGEDIKNWDLVAGAEAGSLKSQGRCLSIASDCRHAFSLSGQGILQKWDLATGLEISSKKLMDGAEWLSITPDGSQFLCARWGNYLGRGRGVAEAELWSYHPRERIARIEFPSDEIVAVDISADGQFVLIAFEDRFGVWGINTGGRLAMFTSDAPLRSCSISPDGLTIMGGDAAGRVYFFRLENVETESTDIDHEAIGHATSEEWPERVLNPVVPAVGHPRIQTTGLDPRAMIVVGIVLLFIGVWISKYEGAWLIVGIPVTAFGSFTIGESISRTHKRLLAAPDELLVEALRRFFQVLPVFVWSGTFLVYIIEMPSTRIFSIPFGIGMAVYFLSSRASSEDSVFQEGDRNTKVPISLEGHPAASMPLGIGLLGVGIWMSELAAASWLVGGWIAVYGAFWISMALREGYNRLRKAPDSGMIRGLRSVFNVLPLIVWLAVVLVFIVEFPYSRIVAIPFVILIVVRYRILLAERL